MAKRKRKKRRVALLPQRRVSRRPNLLMVRPRGVLVLTPVRRDAPRIASRRLPALLSTIPEGRTYHPAGKGRPVLTISGTPSRGLKPAKKPYNLGFIEPKKITVCVRRQRRREVMHALNKAGKSGLGLRKKRHQNEDSKISCKRY